MNSININTSQNVNLSFQLASIGDRMLAFFIDMLIKIAYLIAIWFIFFRLLHIDSVINTWDNWSAGAVYNMFLLPFYFYTLVFESLLEGQTPGKRIRNIRVIKTDAYQANFLDYFARWVFRLVDVFLSSGIVGIIAIITNSENKRLGDMVAGTTVITLKNNFNIDHTILVDIGEEYIPLFPQVIALSDNDMRIIKENYNKALREKDKDIIFKLSHKICQTTQIKYDQNEMRPVQFIDTIIKDYNFYTGDKS